MDSAMEQPPIAEGQDETNDMYNLAADELASKEMEAFLMSLEKNDIGDVLKKDLKKKLEVATTKLNDLFKQQQAMSVEEEIDQAALDRELTLQTAALGEEKARGKADNMRNLLLQKRVVSLNNQVELSEQKAKSVTLQWALDREKYKAEIKQKQIEIGEMQTKLAVMERKSRLHEQLSRDSNMVRGSDGNEAYDTEDVDKLREMLLEAQADLAEKRKQLSEVSRDLSETKMDLASTTMKNELLVTRVEDLVKSADATSDHLELMQKDEHNVAKQLKHMQEHTAELVKELKSEQHRNTKLEEELTAQKAAYEGQISALDVSAMQAKIKALDAALAEQKLIFAEKEKDLKKMADYSRLEKEQIARENKQLTVAINKVAFMTKAITADFEAHKGAVDTRIDADTKKSNTMYAEIKALSKSIDSLAGDAVKRAKEMETRLEQQKVAADAAELEFEKERERLELRVLDMQKDIHAKEKAVKAKIAAATQVETAAKEAAQKELSTANAVIDRLNEKIETLNRRGGGMNASKDAAEKYVTELEAEKDGFLAKMDAKDAAIAQLKKEMADAAAQKASLQAEMEKERAHVDEMRRELSTTKEELEDAEDRLQGGGAAAGKPGVSRKNISLQPKDEDSSAARELAKIKEELQATRKELAAKQKEVKSLQKDEGAGIKKLLKKEESKITTTTGGAKRKQSKRIKVADSDSDSEAELESAAPTPKPSAAASPAFDHPTPKGRKVSRSGSVSATSTASGEAAAKLEAALADAKPDAEKQATTRKKKSNTAGSQTDDFIASAAIGKKRVEAILRESILTDNFYYNKATSKFSNVYPVEEHLMEDMVDSFHNMSQDLFQVLRAVTGHGVSLLESSKKDELDAKQLVTNVEAMILKAGKDLIVNLEKSKERNLKKMMADQRKADEKGGLTEADIQEAKETAVAEVTAALAVQMEALKAERAQMAEKLKESADLLEEERMHALDLEDKLEAAEAQVAAGGDRERSHSLDDESLGSDDEDALATHSEDALAEGAVESAGVPVAPVVVEGAEATSPEAHMSLGLLKTVATAKQKLVAMRKKREGRKAPKIAEQRGSPGAPPSESPSRSSKSTRRKVPRNTEFDDLDTGTTILARLNELQKDELKTMVLLDLTDEVKQNLLTMEIEKKQKDEADTARNHHVMRDMAGLKNDLQEGKLANIGEVQISDFDRLRNKMFGGDDLISLTIVEHHVEYGGAADMYDIEDAARQQGMSKEEARKDALKKRQYRMLIRSMTLQRELLMKNVVTNTPLLDLLRFKHSTEVALGQLAVLSAWRALNYYRNGGVFRDILEVHLGVIDRCIAAAGGWKTALAQIENDPNPLLTANTAQWPEFFRVRVLEVLRNRIAEELKKAQVQLSLASSLPHQQPVTFIQSNEVLPFGQMMETEGNKKRMDAMRDSASMKAEHIMAKDDVHGLNRSIRKLQAKADASFVRFSDSQRVGGAGFEDSNEDVASQVKSAVIRAGFTDSIDDDELSGRSFSSPSPRNASSSPYNHPTLVAELSSITEEIRTNTASSFASVEEGEPGSGAAASASLASLAQGLSVNTSATGNAATGQKAGAAQGKSSTVGGVHQQQGGMSEQIAYGEAVDESKATHVQHKPNTDSKVHKLVKGSPMHQGKSKTNTDSVLNQLANDFNRTADTPDADTVISQLSNSTKDTTRKPPPPIYQVGSTKSQAMRAASKQASNSLKFDKYDVLKREEKKRKAAKAAESQVASQLAAGESMKMLASSLGDMFPMSEDDAAHTDSGDEKRRREQSSVSGAPRAKNTENLQWMLSSADKLIMPALYGDERAQQVMHGVVDGVSHWMSNQTPIAASVFKSLLPMGLVPELLTDLTQRADHRMPISPEVLEVREKFDNILSFIARSAVEAQAREHAFAEMHAPHTLRDPHHHHHSGALVPHLPAHHAHHAHNPHGFVVRGAHDPMNQPLDHAGHPAHPAHSIHPAGPGRFSPVPLEHSHGHGHGPVPLHIVNLDPGMPPLINPSHFPHNLAASHGSPQGIWHSGTGHHHSEPGAEPHSPEMKKHLDGLQVAGEGHIVHHAHPHALHGTHGAHHGQHAYHAHHGHHAPHGVHGAHSGHHTHAPGAAAAAGNHASAQTQAAGSQTGVPPGEAHLHHANSTGSALLPHAPYYPPVQQYIAAASEIIQNFVQPTAYGTVSPQPGGEEGHTGTTGEANTTRSSFALEHYNSAQGPIFHSAVKRNIYSPGQLSTGSKPGTSQFSRKRVAMFENSTQTAHGSIELRDLSAVNEEGNNNISMLVKALVLDGWDNKAKAAVVGKRQKTKAGPHTIVTSAVAVPHTFSQEKVDPFAHTRNSDTPPIYKGFEHAYFDEAEFEVQPGIRLASAHRVAAAIRMHVLAEREKEQSGSIQSGRTSKATPTSTPLNHEDDLHIGSWIMSTNVRYCIRSEGSVYGKRLKRAPPYVNAPEVPGCEAVIFPNVFPVQQGVNLITGEQCRLGGNIALPEDVLLLQMAEETKFPNGLTRVELAPMLKLTSSLQHFLQREHVIPQGHQLVQLTQHSSVALPEGVEVASGVTVAATPSEFDLPSNVILVKNPLNDDLPSYMHKLNAVTNEEDDLIAETKLAEFCCIIKRPNGVDFPLGVEILQRPPGHSLPPGMVLLDKNSYPDGLVLPEELELVQLTPRFDFPLGCRINAEWKVWPRPDGMRLPPGVQIVYPDSTAAVPTLPAGVCTTTMPDIPYGVTLPPNSQAVEIFGTAAGKFPLPEGSILAPGITVLNSDELMPMASGPISANGARSTRAVNVLLVHRVPGTQLPYLVERGSKADLPMGTLLAENMDIVRVAVRFELPAGVRIQAGAKLGPHTQIAPGTDLVTLSGGKPDDDYSCSIRVLEWPHGMSLTPGTEFVRRPPAGYYLPVGYKEVVQPRGAQSTTGVLPPIPDFGMLVELPRAVHYATAQNLAEQVTVGLESTLEGKIVTLPLGMILAARTSRQSQWPAEMVSAPKAALSVNLTRVIDKINSENNSSLLGPVKVTSPSSNISGAAVPAEGDTKATLHIEAVKLKPHYALPPGCEITPGVVVQRKPFWLHVPSGVELVTKFTDSSGHLLPFPCRGITRVQMRPDYIVTGADIDTVVAKRGGITATTPVIGSSVQIAEDTETEAASATDFVAPKSPSEGRKDWELIDMENTIHLSPTTLPDNFELVHVSELLENVYSWGPYLKGVEAVARSSTEGKKAMLLPPLHFLIHRPLIPVNEPLPEGFQLGIATDYSAWAVPSLPPNILFMHLVPTYHLPMGINIVNTSVLSKNQFNTLIIKGGGVGDCNIPQLQAGERISSGFSVVAKPFGSAAMAELIRKDPFYAEESHAFVRVHDPRHFKVPKMMTLDKHSDDIVENVFGRELSWAWRKGYASRHDGGGITEAVRRGELLITDIIKLVRLPFGFPPPRERQKRAQARFAILKPVATKIMNVMKMMKMFSSSNPATPRVAAVSAPAAPVPASEGAESAVLKTADATSSAAAQVPASPGKKEETKLDSPLTHTHTHHKKKESTGALLVYPRLLCIHKRDPVNPEHQRDKYLVNFLLHKLNKPEVLSSASSQGTPVGTPLGSQSLTPLSRLGSMSIDRTPKFKAGMAPIRTNLVDPKDQLLHDEVMSHLQENLEKSDEENTENKAKVAEMTAKIEQLTTFLQIAQEKNHKYETQLSYDEDLKVLIQRLNLKLKVRTQEIEDLNEKDNVATERLQAQVELLNSQVAYYQDLSDIMGANKSFSDPSPDSPSPSAKVTAVADATAALSLEHLEKFSSNLHQKYRDQMLAGLEKVSQLYSGSIDKIMTEFEGVLINWPHWSPRATMLEAVAWSRNQPIPSSGSVNSQLEITTAFPLDVHSVTSQLLTPPRLSNNNYSLKVREPAARGPVNFEDDISVLSDGEGSSLIGANGLADGNANASVAGTEAHSVSSAGYQARDMTKDEHGKAVPITESFPLNLKGMYHHSIAPDPNKAVLSITSPAALNSAQASSANLTGHHHRTLRKREAPVDPSKYFHRSIPHFNELPELPVGQIELSHSLNDLFAKQRHSHHQKGPFVGKLPKIIHSTTATPGTGAAQDDDSVRNIQVFDPAVLGTGASLASHGHGSALTANHAALTLSTEDGMTVSADITAQQVADFMKNDVHRAELHGKLRLSTSRMVSAIRKEFAALLLSVHSNVVAGIPATIEQYKQDTGGDTSRLDAVVEDYSRFSSSSLAAVQSTLDTIAKDSTHLMKYALGGVLLHSDISLQRQDMECDALRHKLLLATKRAEMLDFLLQEARRKSTGDSQNSVQDTLKEKVVSLEGRLDRLQGLHVDPAVSVLAMLVQRLGEITEQEKQLKFTAMLFKQKAAQTEAKVQASHDYDYNHGHEGSSTVLVDSDDEDELSVGSQRTHSADSTQLEVSPQKLKRAKVSSVQLTNKDIKALKHFAHAMRMKARHCHARAHTLNDECTDLMRCIMEHMEAYQRAAQKLLPANLLEQVLRASTRKYQDISAGQKLNRVRSAMAPLSHAPSTVHSLAPSLSVTPTGSAKGTARDKRPFEEEFRRELDTSSSAGESVGPSSLLSPMSVNSLIGGGGGSVSSATSRGSGLNVLKSLRTGDHNTMVQKGLIDATRSIAQTNVRFGAAGSLPMAPAQSHLLLRGTGKKTHSTSMK